MGQFYWIYGSDEQAVKKRAAALAEKIAENKSQCDIETISGDTGKYEDILQELINDLQTPPFLTPEKVVFLRYFTAIDKFCSSADDLTADAVDLILNADESVHVILECIQNTPDMRKSTAKKLKAAATVEIYDTLKSTDKNFAAMRSDVIREKIQERSKSIDPDALKFLVETLGTNSGILDNELDKLCTYLGNDEKRITLDICRTLCARTPESVIYFFTGSLLDKDIKSSLSTLSDLLRSGEAEIRIMASVNNAITDAVKSRNAMAELNIDPSRLHPGTFNSIPADTKERFPENALLKMHPYRAFKVCESAAKWDPANLAKALKTAAEANLALVSGNGTPRLVLEQMVLKICML